jgi:hypothetical protein
MPLYKGPLRPTRRPSQPKAKAHPTPPPARPTPSPIPGRLKTLQKRISRIHQQVVASEMTGGQRRLGKLPEPRAVERLGGADSRVVGQATLRVTKEPIASAMRLAEKLGLSVLTPPSAPKTEIALTFGSAQRPSDIPGAVRHEAAHHILARRGVEGRQDVHHKLISQSKVAQAGGGSRLHFGLLGTARKAQQVGGSSWGERLKRRQEKLRFGQMRKAEVRDVRLGRAHRGARQWEARQKR